MKISAIVIVYNEYFRINTCLASLYGQVDEIVLIDDGSNQHVGKLRDLYQYWEEMFKVCDCNLKVYNEQHTGNHGKWLSKAFERTTGDWLLQLDGDEVLVTPEPNTLNRLVGVNGDVVGVRCGCHNIDQNGSFFVRQYMEPKIRFYKRDSGYFPDFYAVEWKFKDKYSPIFNASDSIMKINHIRTADEKHIDEKEYFRKFVEGFKDAKNDDERKYYRDSFVWVGEHYGWQQKTVEEVLQKGIEQCLSDMK